MPPVWRAYSVLLSAHWLPLPTPLITVIYQWLWVFLVLLLSSSFWLIADVVFKIKMIDS